LGEREPHLQRERREMRGRQVSVPILNQVQVLDQEVAPARPLAQERTHLLERLGVDLAAFWSLAGPPAARLRLGGMCDCAWEILQAQNSPAILPSGPTSMASAAGTLGRPGMVMISPQIATTNSAPAESRTSRSGMMWSEGAPLESGLVEKLYWVLAMQTGNFPAPI